MRRRVRGATVVLALALSAPVRAERAWVGVTREHRLQNGPKVFAALTRLALTSRGWMHLALVTLSVDGRGRVSAASYAHCPEQPLPEDVRAVLQGARFSASSGGPAPVLAAVFVRGPSACAKDQQGRQPDATGPAFLLPSEARTRLRSPAPLWTVLSRLRARAWSGEYAAQVEICVDERGSVESWSVSCPGFFMMPAELDGLGRLQHRPLVVNGRPAPFCYSVWAPTNHETCQDACDD